MLVDGRAIAQDIKDDLARTIGKLPRPLSLAVFVGDSSLATQKFIGIKTRTADELGVTIVHYPIDAHATTETLMENIRQAGAAHDGIIIQFPLPKRLDRTQIQNAVPATHDVDVISSAAYRLFEEGGRIMPPVAGALEEICMRHQVNLRDKTVVIVGEGQLVGTPAATWARLRGASVVTLNADSSDISKETKHADVLILGAGVPGLIKPDMIRDSAVVLDAGTSEAAGKLSGDADSACAERAALFTPVPGGIGPITVAVIFRNLYDLQEARKMN